MKLWKKVDWTHQLEKSSVSTLARMFRVKLKNYTTLDEIAPALSQSRYWISFAPDISVDLAMRALVDHLVETYGLGVVLRDGALHDLSGDRSWPVSDDPKQGARTMRSLKRAEPRLEPRAFVKNGSSSTQGWAVFSSMDWAEMEAADVYATQALFPVKGKLPPRPKKPRGDAPRRERDPEHAALLAWVTENKDEFVAPLLEALEKLETSHPGSREERDANTQIFRIGRRARR